MTKNPFCKELALYLYNQIVRLISILINIYFFLSKPSHFFQGKLYRIQAH